jgi:hypothetical protein
VIRKKQIAGSKIKAVAKKTATVAKKSRKKKIRKKLSEAQKQRIKEKYLRLKKNKPREDKAKKKNSKKQKLQLISKRGTRFERSRKCDKCDKVYPVTWRYAKSTKGTVYLCVRCKAAVPRVGARKVDALDHAITGGHFEGNRRRH